MSGIDLNKTQIVCEADNIPKKLGAFVSLFLKRHPWTMLIFTVFILYEAFIAPMNAYLLKIIIDSTISTGDHLELLIPTLLMPGMLYVGVQVMMNVIFSIYRYFHLLFYPKAMSDIAGTMHHYLTGHSYRYFSEHFSGSLSKKILDLCMGFESLVQIMVHNLIPKTLSIIGSSIILYFVQPYFGALLFIWAIIYIGISYMMSKGSEKLSYAMSEAGNNMNGKLVDSIVNVMSAKLFANAKHEEGILFGSIDNLMAKDRKLQWYLLKANILQGILIAILIFLMLSALIYARIEKMVTIGDFALILTLSSAIANNIYNMGEQILGFAKMAGNCRQSLNMIVEPHEIKDEPDAKALIVSKGKIVFEKVQFHYQGSEQLFDNKTVSIEPGQKVGLVGHSGSGKSTFVNLILRLFEVNQGRILIDDQDVKKVTQSSLRKNIGMIPQDPSLFHRSLLDNIGYAKVDATKEEIIAAARQAHADEFISALAQGYDALVGERGVKLSGGQRQRIAIARAFLKNAPILILDEATSQLDSLTEQYIQDSLWTLMQNKTTIVVAHRLSTLLHMDRILVFEKGKIIEDGTHAALLAQNGHYAQLWKAQVGGFLLDEDENSENGNNH